MKKWVFASLAAVGLGIGLGSFGSTALAQSDEGTIEGRVYDDADADGIRDAAEEGIEGVTVRLSGKLKRSTETDRNGRFTFDELPDGSYDVTVELDQGWAAVKDFTAYKDLEVEGASLDDVDFALQAEDEATADDEADDEPTEEAVAEADEATEEAGDEAADEADDEATDEASDEATDDVDDVDDDADDADDAEAVADEVDEVDDDIAMEEAAAELMASLSDSGIDPAVLDSIQRALDSAMEDGDSTAATKALEEAMAALPKNLRDHAAAMATDMAAKAEAMDDDDADDAKDMAPANTSGGHDGSGPAHDAGRPADSMPGTGGGALALGALVAAALAALGGLGRTMERRRA